MPRVLGLLLLFAAVLTAPAALAQGTDRVEVIQVSGIVDSSVERALLNNLELAEKENAGIVVVQIDSSGVLGTERTRRLTSAVRHATVPVATWIGPPGSRAANGAALIAAAGTIKASSPGSMLGPLDTLDLRGDEPDDEPTPFDDGLVASTALKREVVDFVAPSIEDLLVQLDEKGELGFDRSDAIVRFHQLDLWGRLMHAAAQPSVAYLLLLVALVGIVFELFHPSTGPAGVSGLAALALSVYGIATLGGAWTAFALIVAGVAAFCVDLRYSSLGAFTAGGVAALTAGSILLFRSPYLRPSPWIIAFGVISMTAFMVSAMTRVLRDLRAVARGELEVTDAHPHPNGAGGLDEA